MGVFFRSLGRELGKNTGKRLSNAIFGDKWSTPYRVGRTKDEKPTKRKKKDEASTSQQKVIIREVVREKEPVREIVREKEPMIQLPSLSPEEVRAWEAQSRREQERIDKYCRDINEEIVKLSSMPLPTDESKLVALLRSLLVQLSAKGNDFGIAPELKDAKKQLSSVRYAKYCQAYTALESVNPDNPLLWDFYCSKIKGYFNVDGRHKWPMYWLVAGVLLFFMSPETFIILTFVIFIAIIANIFLRTVRLQKYRRYRSKRR